ncbi:hypothetical protein NDU88_006785 [Pleurodeles waltl]|uniref:CCHC-type domain-containing protein n=1 Tax=Pleurodeles waltl TaxID=8319 RepID=A0AAV7WGM7_PLEWA|nr:hypothetical protein NDU88_006785 [Pleurodeles waltl]
MAAQGGATGRSARVRDLQPPEFQVYSAPTRPATRWKRWLRYLENYFQLTEVTDPCTKRAALLRLAGVELQELFDSLPDTGGASDYEKAASALTAHFRAQVNPDLEELTFRRARQQRGEAMLEFHWRLVGLASSCEFVDAAREIRMQVILGCRSDEFRTEILCKRGIPLESILGAARAWEQADELSAHLRRQLRVEEAAAQSLPPALEEARAAPTRGKHCTHCGGSGPHRNQCPARGATCGNCGKMNHYARVCQSRRRTHHR